MGPTFCQCQAEVSLDRSPWTPDNDDAAKIKAGSTVPCRICEKVYGRERPTSRYCSVCFRGFCESEHGCFRGKGRRALCVCCVV